jgi:hypothetical protein
MGPHLLRRAWLTMLTAALASRPAIARSRPLIGRTKRPRPPRLPYHCILGSLYRRLVQCLAWLAGREWALPLHPRPNIALFCP